jgi:hypothetical protein
MGTERECGLGSRSGAVTQRGAALLRCLRSLGGEANWVSLARLLFLLFDEVAKVLLVLRLPLLTLAFVLKLLRRNYWRALAGAKVFLFNGQL